MEFGDEQQRALLEFILDICGRRRWRVHAVGMDLTHVHVVVSWSTNEEPDEVKNKLKNLMSLLLNKRESRLGRRVFSTGSGGATRIQDREHLAFLVHEYLPGQGGLAWCERR